MGYRVVEHIEKKHPEHEKVSFVISCPEDGCGWGTWWNTILNNRAEGDARLLDHLEVRHNANSPRYDPIVSCQVCGHYGKRSEHHCKTGLP
jgi:hypothetical protein